MLMTGASSIRDVMAFPKTQTAACLLTSAPSPVDEAQLKELALRLRTRAEAPELMDSGRARARRPGADRRCRGRAGRGVSAAR